MTTRFTIDTISGEIARSLDGVQLPAEDVMVFTAGDVLKTEVVLKAGATDVTAAFLADRILSLGLRAKPGMGALLGLSTPQVMAGSVATCTFSLNTKEVYDFFATLSFVRESKVYFEVQVANADDSERLTIVQSPATLRREVIPQGSEPPATAAASAANATQKSAEAAQSATNAADSAIAAAGSAAAAEGSATDANTARIAAQAARAAAEAARTAAEAALVAAQAARDAAQIAQTAAANSAAAALAQANAAAASATASDAAKIAAQASQTATEAAQAAALASQTAAALSATNAATSEGNAANSATLSANSATAAAASAVLTANAVASQFIGGVAGTAVPNTATAAGYYYRITTAGTSQGKTWAVGDLAIYNGTSGSWTQLAGILPYSTVAQAIAGTDTTTAVNPLALAAHTATLSRAPRPGIASSGAAALGATPDNTGLAAVGGTANNFTVGMWVRLPTWVPAATVDLFSKTAGSLGFYGRLSTGGLLRLQIGDGAVYTTYSTAATGLTPGAWACIVYSLDRAGNWLVYLNGTLFATVSIAAQAAQTLTNTGPLKWLDQAAGSLGECWIVAGILSASRILDIHRSGSIAPFCAWAAPDATTGQSVATIDTFAFVTWPDFTRGYGAIAPDRSGRNQHSLLGATGLTHIIPRNTPGVPQRAPKTALNFDGSSVDFVKNTLAAQNPGGGDFTLTTEFVLDPASLSGTLAGLTNDTVTGIGGTNTCLLRVANTGADLWAFFGGSSLPATNNLIKQLAGFKALFAGDRVRVILTRAGAVVKLFLGVRGELRDITSLFTDTSSGTAPAFSNTIDGQYLYAGTNGSSSPTMQLFDARVYDIALTEAQLREEYLNGEPQAQWIGASQVGIITGADSTFASDTTWWNKSAGAVISSGSCTLGAGDTISRNNLWQPNKWYRITVTIISGASVRIGNGTSYIQTISASGSVILNSGPVLSGQFALGSIGGAVVDTLTLEQVGLTTRLHTDLSAGLTRLNECAANGSSDFLLSATGVTGSPMPPTRTQIIRDTLVFSGAGNLQIRGASVVDTSKRWRIHSSWFDSDASINVSLGSASAGAQYVSSQAVTSSAPEIGTYASRVINGANLWVNASGAATVKVCILLERMDTL